ncbi:MAG: hypothetical protein K9K66_13100 [Desulfarculaceae bacterium]|nr:hypothetical protein [Desulfarculaceae bacterium]MCF8072709.1 hypothetical protein [Desulfarculaceae bacterium]MCF8102588.1 hypothetical protein [Desulfarculaceae bacterium]
MPELIFANARLSLGRWPELEPLDEYALAGRRVIVCGRPGWRVDYQGLSYESGEASVQSALEGALAAWLEQGRLSAMAGLSGAFLVLVASGDTLEQVLASDELPNTVYWWQGPRGLELGDDWRRFTASIDPLAWESYDPEQLAWFSRRKTCAPGRTYLKGLNRLSAATLYQAGPAGLEATAAALPDPPSDGRVFTWEDLYAVVGRRLSGGPYSLCYSTGIDSHHLLYSQLGRIDDVLTIYYAAPYQDIERSQEAAAALVNCLAAQKPYRAVEVDFSDPAHQPRLEHAAGLDPFAAHYSASMYRLFEEAGQDTVLSGQNADTMQFFALTSRMGPRQLLFKSPASPQSPPARVAYRLEAARSFGGVKPGGMLDQRMLQGHAEQLNRLTGGRGYWPILQFKRMHNMTTGNTALFKNAARFWNKTVRFPYLEPLVFYVSAYFRRPLGSILDPKKHLRQRYHRVEHHAIPLPVGQGEPFAASPLFAWAAQGLANLAPELKQRLDATVSEPLARVVLYTFARMAAEGPKGLP